MAADFPGLATAPASRAISGQREELIMMKLRSEVLGPMSVVAVAGAMAATGLTAASAS